MESAKQRPRAAHFLLAAALVASLAGCVSAADPDPLRDFDPPEVPSNYAPPEAYFKFDLLHAANAAQGPGGNNTRATSANFPALRSQGISYTLFNMRPCGQNLPHTHPRATEILYVISGGPVLVGFVDTNQTAHLNMLREGEMTVFPRGMLHFIQSFATTNVTSISALNSQNPGVIIQSRALFDLPSEVVATTFSLPQDQIRAVNGTLPVSQALALGTSNEGCVSGVLPPELTYLDVPAPKGEQNVPAPGAR
ncbi:hypothetical protein KFL_000230265 [Klebsormidium nitens]|uniref:Germin-like protein n=1 Tax=Klebsormidium nitens TaxID=105231 RepID=A0A1Y1HR52_KLENI|nr:hypothetical protein KFL_000230265 [Klebsormidium nitens]|eukprot:GAQ79047.1 hypothetical protein KFL_000230265 [Klebsormidium nitens]